MTTTTIQLKRDIKGRLDKYKMHGSESYNEVIERLLEDVSVLNEQTKNEIRLARRQIAEGKFKTHEQIKREMGF